MASIHVKFINDNTNYSYNCGDFTKGQYDKLLELPNFDDINEITSACINHIEKFPKSIKKFICYRYDTVNLDYGPLITELPELPEGLIELQINFSLIKELPKLPSSLRILNCSHNKNLVKISDLPEGLQDMICVYNSSLENLPDLPNSLKYLDCSNNNLKSLPFNINNPNLNVIWNNNPIYNVLNSPRTALELYVLSKDLEEIKKRGAKLAKEKADVIGYMYLEAKYNPKFKMCRDRLTKEYTEIYNE